MRKKEFNEKLRDYARTLSPRKHEQDLINRIYESFNTLFGVNNCIQIGSYPRFTAITPIHDLDILYILGNWDENNHDPSTVLQVLYEQLSAQYENPTDFKINISLQTHSVTISYKSNDEEILSVDIVPAYIFSKNEFRLDTYKVPEVIKEKRHKKRKQYYERLITQHTEMQWITSDPRGYIKVASSVDRETNGEFRKTVKIVKRWKDNLESEDESLKLKSFHVEQVITRFFQSDSELEIFDAIFKFFYDLPDIINNPNVIRDRANQNKFIDDYLKDFSEEQKKKIKQARDGFLIKLEKLKKTDSIDWLLEIEFYDRPFSEEFLFDSRIKTFIDDNLHFRIDGFVRPLPGFSPGWLSHTPQLQKGLTRGSGKIRKIEFRIQNNNTEADEHRWKVRNSNDCGQPRGEITLNQTKNHPESTEYIGDHYVECYAIKDEICIAKSKIDIKII